MEELKTTEAKKYLKFRLESNEYGVDIGNIMTIIEKNMVIARVPYTKEYIKGVINLRGDIIPVISLRKRCGIEEIEYNDDTRIIIAKKDEITVGFIVDSVSEVIIFDESSIENISDINAFASEYIFGIGKKDDKIVTLLNLEKLMEIEE